MLRSNLDNPGIMGPCPTPQEEFIRSHTIFKAPHLYDFIIESNGIEGIYKLPSLEQFDEVSRFKNLEEVKISDLKKFVKVYQPHAVLRNKIGLDVRVGQYVPPHGSKEIETKLKVILKNINDSKKSPYKNHCDYEKLHPFTDCNGRSGRILWYWQMSKDGNLSRLGFLHSFYYQALSEARPIIKTNKDTRNTKR